jgi:hypothetical protein
LVSRVCFVFVHGGSLRHSLVIPRLRLLMASSESFGQSILGLGMYQAESKADIDRMNKRRNGVASMYEGGCRLARRSWKERSEAPQHPLGGQRSGHCGGQLVAMIKVYVSFPGERCVRFSCTGASFPLHVPMSRMPRGSSSHVSGPYNGTLNHQIMILQYLLVLLDASSPFHCTAEGTAADCNARPLLALVMTATSCRIITIPADSLPEPPATHGRPQGGSDVLDASDLGCIGNEGSTAR